MVRRKCKECGNFFRIAEDDDEEFCKACREEKNAKGRSNLKKVGMAAVALAAAIVVILRVFLGGKKGPGGNSG